MRSADRRYFFVVGLVCAVGYGYRLWLLPGVALAALEGAVALRLRLRPASPVPVSLADRRARRAAVTHSADRAA
jgi:hypothetical protein